MIDRAAAAVTAWAERTGTTLRQRALRLRGMPAVLDVQRRYTEARGSALAAAISLYGFLALFAVILLAIAVLGFLSAGSVTLATDLPHQLGLTGSAARLVHDTVRAARRSRAVVTVIGVLGLAWTGTSLAVVIADAYNAAWKVDRRGLADRLYGIVWLGGAGVLVALGAGATALFGLLPGLLDPLIVVVSVATNTGLLLWTSWVLPNRTAPLRALVPAALVGGAALEVLKVLGAYVVPLLVRHSSQVYGTIGVVFALLLWLLVFGRLLVYVAAIEARGWERHHGEREIDVEVPALPTR